MIWEPLLALAFAILRGIVGLLPTDDPPEWLDDGAGYVSTVLAKGAGLGAWIPFQLAGTVLAAVLACVAIGFTIKLVRIVASFFTAGGGSAA